MVLVAFGGQADMGMVEELDAVHNAEGLPTTLAHRRNHDRRELRSGHLEAVT